MLAQTNTISVEQIDEAIRGLGSRRLIPEEDIPEFLEHRGKGLSAIKEEINGIVHRYASYWELVDMMLDRRNEIEGI